MHTQQSLAFILLDCMSLRNSPTYCMHIPDLEHISTYMADGIASCLVASWLQAVWLKRDWQCMYASAHIMMLSAMVLLGSALKALVP